MNSSWAKPELPCNCDANDKKWSKDNALLTEKTHLPVKQLRFGDTEKGNEEVYPTLEKFKCHRIA